VANDFDPFIPEWWANASLAILNETLVALPLTNVDFGTEFARGGQVINTRRPARMTAGRKNKTTAITQQDVSAENVAIPLDQHIFNSFEVHDLDQQWSMQDLISTYLAPASFALAKMADGVVLGQMARFAYGDKLAGDTSQTTYSNFVDARAKLDNNLAYSEGRNLILNPSVEAKLLKDQVLYQVNTSGSSRALRAGEVGNLVGFNLFKTQNLVSNTIVVQTGVASFSPAAAAVLGATTFTANQSSPVFAANDWISIKGRPYKITGVAGGSDPRTITLNKALHTALTTSDVIYVYKAATASTGYVIGWQEPIVTDAPSSTYIPKAGDMVEIGSHQYGVLSVPAANTLVLDRPLQAAVSSSDPIRTIPGGTSCFAFHRDAISTVIRPLAPTRPGTGVASYTAAANGLSVRAQMWYDAEYQKMKVSLDFLMGVQVLDLNLGVVINT
jgi:hypothetical protein